MESGPTNGTVLRTYDADEALALMGIARPTGLDVIKRGDFSVPVIKAGRRAYVPKEPVKRLLAGLDPAPRSGGLPVEGRSATRRRTSLSAPVHDSLSG